MGYVRKKEPFSFLVAISVSMLTCTICQSKPVGPVGNIRDYKIVQSEIFFSAHQKVIEQTINDSNLFHQSQVTVYFTRGVVAFNTTQ